MANRDSKVVAMEKGCILPLNLAKEVTREDNVVLYSLARFCGCTTQEIINALTIRNQIEGNKLYGYKRYIKTIGKKIRAISEPVKELADIQQKIKERLLYIPVSFACTGGRPGDSVEINTELHRYNQYLITLDIKNSYPSINTHRVYSNFLGTLNKPLKVRCPHITTDKEKELFIRALTHLCVYNNELPQGASTSNQIQNIAMTRFDTKIEKKLPELVGSNVVYSRYADDIAISFPNFSTMDVLKEKMENYNKELKQDSDKAISEQIKEVIAKFSQDTFITTDNFELKYLQKRIDEIKSIIEKSYIDDFERREYIGIIDRYKQKIIYSDRRISNITDEIIKIIGDEGRKINFKKAKSRTPQSNNNREINGMSFDKEGKRGLDKKTKAKFIRLFSDLLDFSLEEMKENKFYSKKFKLQDMNSENEYIYINKIINTINGTYKYIAKIYNQNNLPKDLSEAHRLVKEKREDYTNWKKEEKKGDVKREITKKHIIKDGYEDLPF